MFDNKIRFLGVGAAGFLCTFGLLKGAIPIVLAGGSGAISGISAEDSKLKMALLEGPVLEREADAISVVSSQHRKPFAEVLFSLLTSGDFWHATDLETWEGVDSFARGFEFLADQGGSSEMKACAEHLLGSASSVQMTRTALVLMGASRSGEFHVVSPYMEDPETRAAAAYAMGRTASLGSVEWLIQEAGRASGDHQQQLDYGIASAGDQFLDEVLSISVRRYAFKKRPDYLSPLGMIRDPRSVGRLEELACGKYPEPLRVDAARAFANSVFDLESSASAPWLRGLVISEDLSASSRASMAEYLVYCSPQEGALALETLLRRGVVDEELLAPLLFGVRSQTLSEGLIMALEQLSRSGGDLLREGSMHALVRSGHPEALRTAIGILPRSTEGQVQAGLDGLSERAGRRNSEGDVLPVFWTELECELLAELLAAPMATTEQLDRCCLLSGRDPRFRDRALSAHRSRGKGAALSTDQGLDRLIRYAPLLGEESAVSLKEAWEASETFLGRMHLSASAVTWGDFGHDEETERFIDDVLHPHLIEQIEANMHAPLAYAGRNSQKAMEFGATLVNSVAIHGSASDVRELRSVAARFANESPDWPAALRRTVQNTYLEVASRSEDLLNLRDLR